MERIRYLVLVFLLAGGQSAWARDGRDRALPDEYECPGCGGWEQYRNDLKEEHKREKEERFEELKERQDSLIYEQRRQNELLEEQNEILEDIKDNQRWGN